MMEETSKAEQIVFGLTWLLAHFGDSVGVEVNIGKGTIWAGATGDDDHKTIERMGQYGWHRDKEFECWALFDE
jgi:hypothetical protein